MTYKTILHKLIPFLGLVFFVSQISNVFNRTMAFCDRATLAQNEEISFKLLEFLQSCSWEFQLSVLIFFNYWFFAIICVAISFNRKNLHNIFFSKVILKQIWKDSILNVFLYYIPIMVLSICHELLIKTKKGVILPHIFRGFVIFLLLALTPYHLAFLSILVFYGHLVLICLSFILCYLHVTPFKNLVNTNFFKGNIYMSKKFVRFYFGNPASSLYKNLSAIAAAATADFTLNAQRTYERSTVNQQVQPAVNQEAAYRAHQGNVMSGQELLDYQRQIEEQTVRSAPASFPLLSAEHKLNDALNSIGLGPANKIIADAIKDSNN